MGLSESDWRAALEEVWDGKQVNARPGITTRELADRMSVSYNTACRIMGRAVSCGAWERVGTKQIVRMNGSPCAVSIYAPKATSPRRGKGFTLPAPCGTSRTTTSRNSTA